MKSQTVQTLLLSGMFLLLTAVSCEKDNMPPKEDQLPPITQTGAYTFGCLLDGRVWLPKHYSNSIVNPPVVLSAALDQQRGIFGIGAHHWRKDEDSPKEDMYIYTFTDSIGDKIYLGDSIAGSGSIYEYEAYKNGPYSVYKSVIGKNSWIHFSRFDTINRIASGTFSVDLLNEDDNQDTVRIREGRFDVPF